MSLLNRDQRILAAIDLLLTQEAPELAVLFSFFNRLVQDDGPPPPELPAT